MSPSQATQNDERVSKAPHLDATCAVYKEHRQIKKTTATLCLYEAHEL